MDSLKMFSALVETVPLSPHRDGFSANGAFPKNWFVFGGPVLTSLLFGDCTHDRICAGSTSRRSCVRGGSLSGSAVTPSGGFGTGPRLGVQQADAAWLLALGGSLATRFAVSAPLRRVLEPHLEVLALLDMAWGGLGILLGVLATSQSLWPPRLWLRLWVSFNHGLGMGVSLFGGSKAT